MGGCSVLNCTNSARKGFHMCRIPQNRLKRKLWLEKMNRTDWEPGSDARVCEEHFTSDMWESVEINKRRKLKADAIPTIFPEPLVKKQYMEKAILGKNKKQLPAQDTILISNIHNNDINSDQRFIVTAVVVPTDTTYLIEEPEKKPSEKKPAAAMIKPQTRHHVSILRKRTDLNTLSQENSELATTSKITLPGKNNVLESHISAAEKSIPHNKNIISHCHLPVKETTTIKNTTLENSFISKATKESHNEVGNHINSKELNKKKSIFSPLTKETMAKIIHKQQKQIIDLKTKLKCLRKQQSKRDGNLHNIHKLILETLFSEEQIRVLISKNVGRGTGKVHKWSKETIDTALRLKFSCGNTGYNELLKMGFPFPSQRTLRETLGNKTFLQEIKDDGMNPVQTRVNVTSEENESQSLDN